MGSWRSYLLLTTAAVMAGLGVFLLVAPTPPQSKLAGAVAVFMFGGVALSHVVSMTSDRLVAKARERRDTGPRAEFRVRRLYLTAGAGGLLIVSFACWLGLGMDNAPTGLLWTAIALFSAGALVLIGFMLGKPLKIVIDRDGVWDTRELLAPLPWSRIRGASWAVNRRGIPVIELDVDEALLSDRNGRPLRLIAVSLDGTIGEVAESLFRFAPDPSIILPEGADDKDDPL
jgi:hypothetical protein